MNFESIKTALICALSELGVGEYEIYYKSSQDSTVETLDKQISSYSSGERGGLCLRVLVEGRMGYASTELMDEAEMRSLVLRAIENAKATEKPDTVGIYGGSDSYERADIPEYTPMSAAEMRTVALDMAQRLYAESDCVKQGTASMVSAYSFTVRIINSHGLDIQNSCGSNTLYGEAVVESDGESQVAYAIRPCGADMDGIIAEAAKCAVEDAMSKIGAQLVPSGKYNCIIGGKAMRSILQVFSGIFSAKRVLDGLSRLDGQLGKQIFADCITLTDDPGREGSSICSTFDAEGVATHRKAVVERGVLKTYLHNRETAKQMDTVSTANASKGSYDSSIGISPYSFCIEPGEFSLDQLYAMAGDGVLVTEVKGLHAGANSVTGDFSLESAGFMIRDGKRAEAVKSFTIAGNFFELLREAVAVGDKIEAGVQRGITNFGSPAVLIPNMSIAGK